QFRYNFQELFLARIAILRFVRERRGTKGSRKIAKRVEFPEITGESPMSEILAGTEGPGISARSAVTATTAHQQNSNIVKSAVSARSANPQYQRSEFRQHQ
ncbi:hypothetical protein DMN77_17685, partial [Paenibacillus sp. 79R4]|nr:hypothetical protein [Paenibacillus sp. 79R4]